MTFNVLNDSIKWDFQVLPQNLWPTFEQIFPDLKPLIPLRSERKVEKETNIYLLIHWQSTLNDMSIYSDVVEEEREEKTRNVCK